MRFTVLFRLLVGFVLGTMLAASAAGAGAKVHVITFGKWTWAQWLPAGSTEGEKPLTMKVRALIVNGRIKDVVGAARVSSERRSCGRSDCGVREHWRCQQNAWVLRLAQDDQSKSCREFTGHNTREGKC